MRGGDVGALGRGERADGVHERAAGADELGGGGEQPALEGGEAVDGVGLDAPAGVGAAAQGAEAGARARRAAPGRSDAGR